MTDFKELISVITDAVDSFNKNIPGIQKSMLDDVMLRLKKLDIKDDKIRISGANLKVLSDIKARLQNIILSPQFKQAVKEYVGTFEKVTELQNKYFTEVEEKFKPPKLTKEISRQAIKGVVGQLTESGLAANITDKIHEMMRKAVTGGAKYANLQQQLTDFLTNNDTGDGQLLKYTRQITTDALNQFSGQYTQIITSDLGFEWFRYSGSNLTTTRPFCLACTDRKFFHISEIPDVIKGEFEEFKKIGGKINPKSGLPEGMIPGTDAGNFQTNRGGYNCGHQWRPADESRVPQSYQDKVYASAAYKSWVKANGKKIVEVEKPEPEVKPVPEGKSLDTKEATAPTLKPGQVDLSKAPPIKNIQDVKTLFKESTDKIKDWFHNSEFKDLAIIKAKYVNGSTDMNGKIWLSKEKAKLVAEALSNIQKEVETTLDQEKAMATMWHEVWHNQNKNSATKLDRSQTQYMELGNEFVARKTLNQFLEKFGGKLYNTGLMHNRTDTAYNVWVRNFDHLIKYFKADQEKVLAYMVDKMRNGNYEEVKTYLMDAIEAGLEKGTVKKKEINIAVMDAVRLGESMFIEKYDATR